ncbi:MAG: hypothetical protein WD426_05205 [Anditalea sp.]
MNNIKVALFIGVLILLGVGIYYQLGGFNKVGFSIEYRDDVKLLGLTYRGTPQDEEMAETFREIGNLVQAHSGTNLHTVYSVEPAGKLDTLQVFVGIEYRAHLNSLDALEVMNIPCSRVIVADIQAHKLVMPSPNTVKKELEAFAKEKGVATQGIYVDKIMDKGRVEVIAPLE